MTPDGNGNQGPPDDGVFGPLDRFSKVAEEIRRAYGLAGEPISKLNALVDNVWGCIASANRLIEAEAPHSPEMMESLRIIATSVEGVARQVEQISAAAVVVSTQSLARIGRELQRAVAEIAVAQTADPGPETGGP